MHYNIFLDNGMTGQINTFLVNYLCGIFYGCILGSIFVSIFIEYLTNTNNWSESIIYTDDCNKSEPDNYISQYKRLKINFDNLSESNKANNPTQLEDRMKYYEDYTEKYIIEVDPYTQFIIRLDGRSFSKLLSTIKTNEFNNLKTPFINDFKLAMDNVTSDLVKEFNATTGYNHSDEISLVFRALNDDNTDNSDDIIKEHMFNGRVTKLLSLTASYASVRLSKYLRQLNSDKFDVMYDRVSFDSRIIIFPSDIELCNYFVWRSKYDCYRNFVNELVYRYFPKKSLDKLNTTERVEKLRKEYNIDVNDFNIFLRNGTFVKRQLSKYTNYDGESFWRNIYVRFALPNYCCAENYYNLLLEKNFEEWEYQDIEFELVSEL